MLAEAEGESAKFMKSSVEQRKMSVSGLVAGCEPEVHRGYAYIYRWKL